MVINQKLFRIKIMSMKILIKIEVKIMKKNLTFKIISIKILNKTLIPHRALKIRTIKFNILIKLKKHKLFIILLIHQNKQQIKVY